MSAFSRLATIFSTILIACVYIVSAAPIANKNLIKESDSTTTNDPLTTTILLDVPTHAVKAFSKAATSGSFTGDGTYYAPGLGSCGWTNSENDMIAALNHGQMANGANSNNNPNCGRSVSIKGPKGSVNVKIVDTCPGCASGDIDLSPAAFAKIADLSAGRVKISWSWN
ncbi:RlpA-like double-psi beta-barrel-protein domain-containing protein-containing protein [Blakeslea trispora]|nr:RlpA-like double-psi beta-barrel-protein domain-containing protein-containing protein [Blakeslea trispora]